MSAETFELDDALAGDTAGVVVACRGALEQGASTDMIEAAYQRLLAGQGATRRARGAFYTPQALVDRLITIAMDAAGAATNPRPLHVLDPACGLGAFLRGVARWYRAHRPDLDPNVVAAHLHGIDIDPTAVALAQLLLAHEGAPSADLIRADALVDRVALPAIDVVAMNPPFGNAIEKRTKRTDRERDTYAARYPDAATGAYDKAGLFVDLASQRLSDGGVIAAVLPRALLAAPYADRLRAAVTQHHGLYGLVVAEGSRHFQEADVYVAGVLLGGPRTSPQGFPLDGGSFPLPSGIPHDQWGTLLSPHASVLSGTPPTWPTLGDLVTIQASATTGEAYDLRPHVSEGGEGFRLVTTGAIEPFALAWGKQTQRYLKGDFTQPRIPEGVVPPRRAQLYRSPKVLVAGLSRVLEAAVDPDGGVAGAVATLSVTRGLLTPAPFTLDRIAAFLNSSYARRTFLARFGALALGGGSVQVTKKKLAQLRIPPCLLDAGAAWTGAIPTLPVAPTHTPTDDAYDEALHAWIRAYVDAPGTTLGLLDRMRSPASRIAAVDIAIAAHALDNP